VGLKTGFSFGAPVSREWFFDRESELERVLRRVTAIKHGARTDVVLIGPRRVGKSSLAEVIASKASKKGLVAIKIDCEGLDAISFLKEYGNEVASKTMFEKTFGVALKERLHKGFTEAITALSEALGRVTGIEASFSRDFLKLRIEVEKAGAVGKLSDEELNELFEKTLELPERLSKEVKKKFVIIFDEFQETKKFVLPKKDFYASYRRVTQKHKNVVYVYTGSAIGMIEDVFGNPENPLAGNADMVYIQPFSKEVTKRFLEKRFQKSGKKISLDSINFLYEATGGFPAYLNWVGLRINDLFPKKGEIPTSIVKQAFEDMLSPSSPVNQMVGKQLAKLGAKTKRVMSVMALGFRKPGEIALESGTKNVYVYLDRLRKYGLVQKTGEDFTLVDPVIKALLEKGTLQTA